MLSGLPPTSVPSWFRRRADSDSSEQDSNHHSSSADYNSDHYSVIEDSSDDDLGGRGLQFAADTSGGQHTLPHAAQRLPASLKMREIKDAVSKNRVVCVLGDTGCGKSTVIPFALGNGSPGTLKILCTQPRRMAAISLCEHVQSKFYGQRNHPAVGYRVRGQRTDGEESVLVYVTAGYLKTMLTHDPDELSKFTHLILDEVHERGIDSDFLSLIVKRLMSLPENGGTKLVVMSATLESNLFVDYFQPLNGGTTPVTVDLTKDKKIGKKDDSRKIDEYFIEDLVSWNPHAEGCVRALDAALQQPAVHGVLPGEVLDCVQNLAVDLIINLSSDNFSTLVFLPGLGEILSVQERLVDVLERRGETVVPLDPQLGLPDDSIPTSGHYYHIFVLHSTMPYEEQKLALKEPGPKGSLNACLFKKDAGSLSKAARLRAHAVNQAGSEIAAKAVDVDVLVMPRKAEDSAGSGMLCRMSPS